MVLKTPLQLEFQYQKTEKKFELLNIKKLKSKIIKKDKLQVDKRFVLGAPIIVEKTKVKSKCLSSRWSVVGVMGLNDKLELCPYFGYANIFGEFTGVYLIHSHSAALYVNSSTNITDNDFETDKELSRF